MNIKHFTTRCFYQAAPPCQTLVQSACGAGASSEVTLQRAFKKPSGAQSSNASKRRISAAIRTFDVLVQVLYSMVSNESSKCGYDQCKLQTSLCTVSVVHWRHLRGRSGLQCAFTQIGREISARGVSTDVILQLFFSVRYIALRTS